MRAAASARIRSSSTRFWPKEIVADLRMPPHERQGGSSSPARTRASVRCSRGSSRRGGGRRAVRGLTAAAGSSSSASAGPRSTCAPSASKALVPADSGDVTRPGTAATMRPSARASRAGASSRALSSASTSTVSCASPTLARTQATSAQRLAGAPHGSSERAHPRRVTRSRRLRLRAGAITSTPAGIAHTTAPSSSAAPASAATAMPSCKPHATVTCAAASPRARLRAISMP